MYIDDVSCLTRVLPFLSSQNLVVFDVGCNVGDFTKECIELFGCKIKEIHGFEPNPMVMKKFQENFGHDFRVQSVNRAVDRTSNSSVILHVPTSVATGEETSPLGSLYDRKVFHSWGPECSVKKNRVSTVSIDDYVRTHNVVSIDYLKIDTEGHEFAALLGAANSLRTKTVKAGQFEYGEAFVDSETKLSEVVTFLNSCGFSVFRNHNLSQPLASDIEDDYDWTNFVFLSTESVEAELYHSDRDERTLNDWAECYEDTPEFHRQLVRIFME